MRINNWMFKVITTYADGMASTIYVSNYACVTLHKKIVLSTENKLHNKGLVNDNSVSFNVFPYG